mmetsp:Transcript_10842/g.14124  ORF Transcript_10842/g.14124 Transcript_10842/m.14124 type:complete len:663 (+) Transcript_10842:334-2322(+)
MGQIFVVFLTVFVFILKDYVDGVPCPNSCSAHGTCVDRVCECYAGFTGADCSERLCPFAAAWADQATATDTAHNDAECSNMGICDRTTGECTCRDFFEGKACERMSCPNACNGYGACQSMKYYATQKDEGEGTVYTYENQWDAEKVYGCACTTGFFSVDCSERHCPTGDDPLTGVTADTQQVNEQQTVTCTADDGYFTLSFRRVTSEYIYCDDALETVGTKLAKMSSITNEGITVTGDDIVCSTSGATITVTFTQDFGDVPMLVADTTGLLNGDDEGTVAVSQYRRGTKEDAYCSNRGICDFASGLCACNEDYETSDGYGNVGTRGDCGYVSETISACPGEMECSLQGYCKDDDTVPTYECQCMAGWQGSDCSTRTCPYGRSWFGFPTDDDEAHLEFTECSSMGVCDREEGTCTCATNFHGAACEYMTCNTDELGECNNNGKCLNMADLAKMATINGVRQDYTYGETPNDPNTWDAEMVYGCLCDAGWTGYDCSLRLCPFGDDPVTEDQENEIQEVSCTGDSGSFYMTFREAITEEISYAASASELEAYLEALDTIEDVSVTSDDSEICTSSGNTFYIEFYMPTADVPLIEISDDTVDSISISEYQAGTKEYSECSGRGLCNREFGECTCFAGFGSSDGKGGVGERDDCGYMIPDVFTTDTD